MGRREDRARATLLGLAWGDVLGCPIEGWDPADIEAYFGRYQTLPSTYPDTVLTLPAHRRRRLRRLGLHSDDTQQALALVASVLDAGSWSLEHWVRWLVAGDETGAWRGFGSSFATAVRALRDGTPPTASGARSAGLGAAMRSAPLGALLHDRGDVLAPATAEASFTTHADVRAGAGAYAVAEAARLLVTGTRPDRVLARLPDAVEAFEDEWVTGHEEWSLSREHGRAVSTTLAKLAADPPGDLAELGDRVSELARPTLPAEHARAHPNEGFVLLGALHGLGAALLLDMPPGDVLTRVVRQGYDTDSVGAICGALLGARHGSGWVPLVHLEDAERLARWADAVAGTGDPPEDRETFMAHEAALTGIEPADDIDSA